MGAIADISAQQCWQRLGKEKASRLIDVRTQVEWTYVGVPDLAPLGKEALFIEWQHFGSSQPNPDFVSSLMALLDANRAQPLFFICRSGQRSRAAATAMAQQSFTACFNVTDGFEGALDENNHRGQKQGWKAASLPWKQT